MEIIVIIFFSFTTWDLELWIHSEHTGSNVFNHFKPYFIHTCIVMYLAGSNLELYFNTYIQITNP